MPISFSTTSIGCGAFYAVIQGNQQPGQPVSSDRLVKLKYNGPLSKNTISDVDDQNKGAAIRFPQTGVTLEAVAASGGSLDKKKQNNGSSGNGGGNFRDINSGIDNQRPVVLVGKGVCFDTGGINLKPANPMKNMKQDMGGSAAALGLLIAMTETG